LIRGSDQHNMGRRKIAAANWKMNLNWVEAFDLATAIREKCTDRGTEVIVFPAFPFIQMCSVIFGDTRGIAVGAQDCSRHAKGAYTGEVSAHMVASAGARYVLVGHSERRQYFREDAGMLKDKLKQALEAQLSPVYCFGELLEERKGGNHFDVVTRQLKDVLTDFQTDRLNRLVLAYEPVWAIGTGETATPSQAQEMHAHVRKTLRDMFGEKAAADMTILYGGSCNAANAAELFGCPDVDGGLVGGASLKADEFSRICTSFA
jgi:triosephosphate isomerase (TIM)